MYYYSPNEQQPDAAVEARKKALLRERIAHAHSKAKTVGMFYLLATIALAALAFLPMISVNGGAFNGNLWVANFWKPFAYLRNFKGMISDKVKFLDFISAVFYTLILLTAIVNVIRSFSKLNWLFKKKPSRFNGYNRNVYAMEDLGKIFSGTFYVLLVFTALIYILKDGQAKVVTAPPYAFIAAGLWFVVHFLFGLCGGTIPLYGVDGGKLYEEKRTGKLIVPIIRNVLQIAVVGAIGFFILKTGALPKIANELLALNFKGLISNWKTMLSAALIVVAFLCWLVLLKHSTSTTEFDRDGCRAIGMSNFWVFSLLIALLAIGAFVVDYLFVKTYVWNFAYIGGIAFVWFVVELCLRKYPDNPDNSEEIDPELLFDKIDSQVHAQPQYFTYM